MCCYYGYGGQTQAGIPGIRDRVCLRGRPSSLLYLLVTVLFIVLSHAGTAGDTFFSLAQSSRPLTSYWLLVR